MKKVLFVLGVLGLLFVFGACTKVGYEGNILGTWDFNVMGNTFEMVITEQGLVTFEAETEAPVEFISGGTSSANQVGMEIRIDGQAYSLFGDITNSMTMEGFVRQGLIVDAGIVCGVWSAVKQ